MRLYFSEFAGVALVDVTLKALLAVAIAAVLVAVFSLLSILSRCHRQGRQQALRAGLDECHLQTPL